MSENTIITPEQIAEEAQARQLVKDLPREELETQYIHLAKMFADVSEEYQGLQGTIEVLNAHLERERQINKSIKRKKNGKKHETPWYELQEALDPENYTRLPFEDHKAFLLGHVDDVLIIEIPRGSSAAEIRGLQHGLRSLGMTSAALMVEEGIRFLKLRPMSKKEAKEAEEAMKKVKDAEAQAQETDEAEEAEEVGEAAPAD